MLKRNMKNKSTSILPAVIILLIVLTGCGKRELVLEQEQEQSRAESKEEILFGSSILQMLSEQDSTSAEESESENMSAAVDETVQKVEESVEMVGEEADSEEADISEELQTGTGNESEVFVEDPYWPENEYTKQIPKPDFEIISARVDEIGFGTDFASTVTTKDVIAYVDVVQNSGFNIDVNSISMNGNSVPFVDIVNNYPKGSAIVTEFKIKLGENYAIGGPLVKFVNGSGTSSTHLIRIETDGRLSNAVNGTTTSAVLKYPGTDTAVTVDKFEWTTIRIVADLANNTKDIYIDGILCLEGAKIKANASEASGFEVAITRLSQLNPGQTGTVYLDDFKSYYAFDVDFENIEPQTISAGTVTDVLTNTRFNHSSSNTGIKIVREGRVNNYLSINSLVTSNDSGYFDVIHAIDAGKTVTVEAKYKLGKVDENNPACRGDMLKFLDPDNKTIALVLLDSDGTLRNSEYAGTSTGPSRTDSIGKLSETEWTTIKVVCDMVNNKKDIYINGVLKVDNAQLYNDNGASTYTIASTRVFQFKSSGIGKLQIDDYRISFE